MHRREGKLILSATDLVGFLECGHLTNLDRALLDGLKKKPDVADDPGLDLLRRRGWAHEERYVEELEQRGRRITRLNGSYERPIQERTSETEEAMRRGDDVIFQASVFDGRWVGHPDFLLRVDGRSALGDWHYEVADTKLAHSAKASALLQICSYVEQVERIQDRRPERVYVVTGGGTIEEHGFRTAEMMAYFRHAKQHFEDALAQELDLSKSYPDPVEHCAVCRWSYAECRRVWREDDALPLVAGISRKQREVLKQNRVVTMTALSVLKQPIQFEGMKRSHAESMWNMREQARLQVLSTGHDVPEYELLGPERDTQDALVADRGLSALPPPSAHDLFFDIEGDPFAFWEGLEYLFGIWDGAQYRQLWAINRDEEKLRFQDVMDLFHGWWKQHPDMHIYHYGAYEPSRLKQLAGRHATRQEELDELLRGRVFVDLLRVVRQGVRVGSERYSIKNLEPLYGYERVIELRDANSSIVEFELYLETGSTNEALRESIAGYNADDCRSTQGLRDWLEERRIEAAREFGVELPRPPAGDLEPPSEDLREHIRLVRELTERLTGSIDNDPAKQSEADKATWLVAHLLDWHRLEDKSTWWRYYDLLSKTDDELFEEADSLGHLEPIDSFDPGGRSRSYVHRYRFPAQEHKIELGYVDDPQLEGRNKRTGEVVGIDEEAGTVNIRRAKNWTGPHPRSLVQISYYDPKEQRESLMRFGEWVAANGVATDAPAWRAARDLLLRRPPRLVGGAGGALVKEWESGSEAARRLALLLDGTTLAIQGPPGSGKTYTGARMILDLVRAGRRVGITSNSHKVIGNLVEAVLDAAREANQTVRIVQKGDEDEVFGHPSVKRADKNGDVAEALAAGEADVAAGTPWLWADADLASTVDTLFVDEAGQVSLANVVAVSAAGRNVVLLGDPQQLDQPTQGVHPGGAGVSALTHLLDKLETVPQDRGVFLEQTWRMNPSITSYTSALFYEGKLKSVPGLERQEVVGTSADRLAGSGLRWVPVDHDGNTNASPEEAARVAGIWSQLVGREWIDADGSRWPITEDDIVIVSPFNAHRLLIQKLLPSARVGTVDKFQGQQAAVSIYTMATSRPEDAPRGMAFLFSLHRLNVATSRARALAIVVASPRLLDAVARTPDQLRMANGLCAFVESAPALGDREPTGLAREPTQLVMELG